MNKSDKLLLVLSNLHSALSSIDNDNDQHQLSQALPDSDKTGRAGIDLSAWGKTVRSYSDDKD